MKRSLYLIAAVLLWALLTVTHASAQESLGEVARQQREAKRPSSAKVYTNDDFAAISVTQADAAAANKAERLDKDDAAAKAEETDKAKLAANFKSKADDLKKNITQLERELDVAQREYRLKVAVYYADVGNNLRDPKKWAEEDRKQRAEIEAKQKAISDAKQKLTDLQEQARKAGVRVE
jgi:colicin import membrane protein